MAEGKRKLVASMRAAYDVRNRAKDASILEQIAIALKYAKGNQTEASEMLGYKRGSRATMRRYIDANPKFFDSFFKANHIALLERGRPRKK